MRSESSRELHFCPVRHGFIKIHVLTAELLVATAKCDLAAEQIVVINGAERKFAGHQALLDSRFKSTILFRFQVGIRFCKGVVWEGFLKARFLDPSRVRKPQAGTRKEIPAPHSQQAQGDTRYRLIAESLIVGVADSCNRRESFPRDPLLQVCRVVQAQPGNGLREFEWRRGVGEEPAILVFKLVSDRRLCPSAWSVVALIHEAGAVD